MSFHMHASDRHTARCTHCGAELVQHREKQTGTCRRLPCQASYIKQRKHEAAESERRERIEFDARVSKLLDQELANVVPDGDRRVLLVVPHLDATFTELPEERVIAFGETLQSAMDEAVSDLQDESNHSIVRSTYAHRSQHAESPLPVINACTTCRGACCHQGMDHAFLISSFLAWRLLTESDQTPAGIVDDYCQRLPSVSCKDSCVFHGVQGCVLPREIRSQTCNEFLCTGIVDRQEELTRDVASVAVSTWAGVCHRVGIMETDASRQEVDLNLNAARTEKNSTRDE